MVVKANKPRHHKSLFSPDAGMRDAWPGDRFTWMALSGPKEYRMKPDGTWEEVSDAQEED